MDSRIPAHGGTTDIMAAVSFRVQLEVEDAKMTKMSPKFIIFNEISSKLCLNVFKIMILY